VVQVEPTEPVLKAPGTEHLKPQYDCPLSNVAFKFNSRRCSTAGAGEGMDGIRYHYFDAVEGVGL